MLAVDAAKNRLKLSLVDKADSVLAAAMADTAAAAGVEPKKKHADTTAITSGQLYNASVVSVKGDSSLASLSSGFFVFVR